MHESTATAYSLHENPNFLAHKHKLSVWARECAEMWGLCANFKKKNRHFCFSSNEIIFKYGCKIILLLLLSLHLNNICILALLVFVTIICVNFVFVLEIFV